MPTLPLRPCTFSGCPAFTSTGRCPEHQRYWLPVPVPLRRYDDRRGSSTQRGYGYAWRKFRVEYLKRNPLCRKCGQPATAVDHIVPKRAGGSDDASNCQPLCHPCHNIKTGWERRRWK